MTDRRYGTKRMRLVDRNGEDVGTIVLDPRFKPGSLIDIPRFKVPDQ